MPKRRRIIIIAGPNGAGKTTFAREYLLKEANCPVINVDLIAAGLSPFDPDRAAIQAGRIIVAELQRRARKGDSFAFETTLSGRVYARLIPQWRREGYSVKLIFQACRILILLSSESRQELLKAGTMSRTRSFVSALIPVCETSKMSINTWWISGSGTIIQALHHG